MVFRQQCALPEFSYFPYARLALTLALLVCAVSPAPDHPSLPLPFECSVVLGGAAPARSAQEVRAALDRIAMPTEGQRPEAWTHDTCAALREYYRSLEHAMHHPVERARLEADAWAVVQEWKQEGRYPEGLTPELWESIRDRVNSLDDFFRLVNTTDNHIAQITRNMLNPVFGAVDVIAVGGPTAQRWFPRLQAGASAAFTFRIVARHHLRHPPDRVVYP